MVTKINLGVDRGVATITLADPERRNVLSAQLITELVAAITEAESDDAVRVVVVTNEGGTFCAGADLSERSAIDDADDVPDLVEVFRRIRQSPLPFVGRVAGHAVAGGMGLAAAMDISVAVDTAKFGFTEVRLGLAPAVISVICLPKMRPADAAEAFLRGNRFDGTEAARLGLVNHAVPADELDAAADAIVTDLLAGGPTALAACKLLTTRLPTLDQAHAFAWTGQLSAELFTADEGKEGMAAYLAKRPPSWITDAG